MRLAPKLLLADLVGLIVEACAISVPALLLYGVPGAEQRTEGRALGIETLRLYETALPPALLALIAFAAFFSVFRALSTRRMQRGDGAAVLRLARWLPRSSLIVRPALWAACGLPYALWLSARGMPREGVLPLLWLFVLNSLLAAAVHSLLYDRVLWRAAERALPAGTSEAGRLHTRVVDELARGALLTSALALLCTVGFTAYLPLSLEQLQLAHRYAPPFILLLLYGGYLSSARASRPIHAYLRAEEAAPERAALAVAAYRAAQRLPLRLGAAMVVACLGGMLFLAFVLRPMMGVSFEIVLLLSGFALSVTAASSLYAILWHRATLRPLLSHLASAPIHPAQAPAPLSQMAKMVVSFGLLIVCACLLSLIWSFVQYKTLTDRHIQRIARDRLEGLLGQVEEARAEMERRPATMSAALISDLAARAGIAREALVYLLPSDGSTPLLLGRPAHMRAPALPPHDASTVRRNLRGTLNMPSLRLIGEYARVPPLGTLALLYPNYRHPAFDAEGGGSLRGQVLALVVFFCVLIFVSGGIVVIAAVDLSRPIRYLERRAMAMAEGELAMPVLQTGAEVDEVGRLSFAFEDMRRTLSEMLRSSTQLNLRLEAEVERRTRELERRNQEISRALAELEQTRGELLRTEKLATMGRIAAGVTSEINNPVNVMTTLPDPIAEEVAEIERLARAAPLDRARIAERLAELRRMVDVLLRGAQRAKEIVQATRIHVRASEDLPSPFDLGQAVDAVLKLFSDLPRHGIEIARDYRAGVRVTAVRSDLSQIVSGWLARTTQRLNAAPPGLRPRLHISIDAEGAADRVLLRMTDNGPLIPAAELDALVEGITAPSMGDCVRAESSAERTCMSIALVRSTG